MLAEALAATMPGTLLISVGTMQFPINHVVAQCNSYYLDGDGVFTEGELIAKLSAEYQSPVFLHPFNPQIANGWEIYSPPVKLKQLIERLTTFLSLINLPAELTGNDLCWLDATSETEAVAG